MNRTKKEFDALSLMSFAMLAALVLYLGVYMINRVRNPVQTALVVSASMTDSTTLSGLVLRDETVLTTEDEYVNVTVEDGEKIAAGQSVAVSFADEQSLERSNYLSVLEQEIADVEEALSDTADTSSGNRDSAISSAVYDLSESMCTGNYSAASTQADALQSLLFRTDTTDATEEYLRQLQSEYAQAEAGAQAEMTSITVDEAGTFSAVLDGFENVTPELIRELTPDGLREVITGDRTIDENAVGKLITSYYWYYAAILPQEDASRLVEGMTVKLSFGRYYGDTLTATVEYVGFAENHEQVVLFRMDKGFMDMMTVRSVTAELIYSEYEGMRVPLKALYRYYACYVPEADADNLSAGDTVTLTLGGESYAAVVSNVGSASAYGELPAGIESGSEADTRPRRCQVVFYWNYDAEQDAPDFSMNNGTVTLADGHTSFSVTNYYDYDPDVDRMCVFTMTGLQAERKKVTLVFAGEEYCLVSSDGEDALREGNEIIIATNGLFDGKVYR